MIPFKFGKLRDVLRRASCVALVALISLNLTLPTFAASGQLQTVGWAETVSSFLMSCGIYPYDTDENGDFTEWSAQSLTALWDEFQKDVTGVAYDIVDITASLAKGVIAIASGRWSVLREFATWIVNKYGLTDSQTGVELGASSLSGFRALDSAPFALSNAQDVFEYGFFCGRSLSPSSDYYLAAYSTAGTSLYFAYYRESYGGAGLPRDVYDFPMICSRGKFVSYGSNYRISDFQSSDSALSGSVYYGNPSPALDSSSLVAGVAVYSSRSALISAFSSASPVFSGIVADTTTVSIPDALSEGTQFGGLTVQGAGEGVTLEQLQELIRDAVQDALKPAVNVVPVVVAPDVDVNANGEISADLDINPSTVPMTASDYSAPNIIGVFPFSIPWDVIAILSALNAEPVRPDFEVSIYVPVLDIHVPFHIGVNAQDAQVVDSAFAVWRNMLLVLMCVGTLILFAKMLL